MQSSNMYPPGKVVWAMRDSDLHPMHRSTPASHASDTPPSGHGPDKLRLFEVLDVEKVFGQVVFARDMLGYATALSGGNSFQLTLLCIAPICLTNTTAFCTTCYNLGLSPLIITTISFSGPRYL